MTLNKHEEVQIQPTTIQRLSLVFRYPRDQLVFRTVHIVSIPLQEAPYICSHSFNSHPGGSVYVCEDDHYGYTTFHKSYKLVPVRLYVYVHVGGGSADG